jgi:5-methylcytosine-specific restriction endonuclease McrA
MACHAWASEVVHHVIDARVWVERGNDFYDESNLIGWCKNCHDAHTARTGGWAGAHE